MCSSLRRTPSDSKVANFSIDLPDANVAIQVSGTFGSRQEEAQRLGRILRPKGKKGNTAKFYSLISNESSEERFSHNRQLFLTEQGYEYFIYSYQQFKEYFGSYIDIMRKQKAEAAKGNKKSAKKKEKVAAK